MIGHTLGPAAAAAGQRLCSCGRIGDRRATPRPAALTPAAGVVGAANVGNPHHPINWRASPAKPESSEEGGTPRTAPPLAGIYTWPQGRTRKTMVLT